MWARTWSQKLPSLVRKWQLWAFLGLEREMEALNVGVRGEYIHHRRSKRLFTGSSSWRGSSRDRWPCALYALTCLGPKQCHHS